MIGEDAGGDADDDALEELRDLRRDLGLGELDLLAHEQRHALGDVLNGCATFWGEVSVAKASQDHGGEDAAGECRADDELRALGGEWP